MRCHYCGLALPADTTGGFHPICADETSSLTSCPDQCAGTCPACDPQEAAS